MVRDLLSKVLAGSSLEETEASALMEEIMAGRVTDAQLGAMLTALKLKGETPEEIAGFALVMRRKAPVIKSIHPLLLDTCGTGGDGANTFNISTAAALVLAGGGVKVAKHGNRSVSSRCGSADVLEALGVKVDLGPAELSACLDRVGIAFLYAPVLHQGMKRVAGPRRELGFRTVFNVLGPLTNPAGVTAQVIGVYSPELVEPVARVLHRLGVQRGFVVHGAGGLDEVSPLGMTKICELRNGWLRTYTLNIEAYGMAPAALADLSGGGPAENASIIRAILRGEPGPRRNAVLLNAALGFMAVDLAGSLPEGLDLAARSIDEGYAYDKLEELVRFTGQLGGKEAVSG
ncbi:MAG TPA: anthranilate phosphoribosyltransferase [Clostridia bacterium]|nr:anthranilate phosphoribosyltransferase [Clostridia bacterium]